MPLIAIGTRQTLSRLIRSRGGWGLERQGRVLVTPPPRPFLPGPIKERREGGEGKGGEDGTL